MRPRRLGRAFRAASGNRLEDRSVLGVGSPRSAQAREQRSANPVKMHPKGIKRLADALEVKRIGHLTMETHFEFMKARKIAAVSACAESEVPARFDRPHGRPSVAQRA